MTDPRLEMIRWNIGKQTWECMVLPNDCPLCKKPATLVALPLPELEKQPDGTNVVCHPALGGCNHGFDSPAVRALNLYGGCTKKVKRGAK